MYLPEEPEPSTGINIVAMIDVIFVILAFFIIATLFLTRSEGLPVNLPNATTAELQPEAPVTITIEADGTVYLNRQPIALDQLTQAVRQQVVPGTQMLVVINADTQVPHGRVVEVMDSLRQVEGVTLAIAVNTP